MYRARTHITERTHTAFSVPQLGSAESGAATKLRPCRVKLRPKTSAKAPTMSPRISERFVLAGRHNGAIATIVQKEPMRRIVVTQDEPLPKLMGCRKRRVDNVYWSNGSSAWQSRQVRCPPAKSTWPNHESIAAAKHSQVNVGVF